MNAVRTILALSVAGLVTACASPGATNASPTSPGMAHMNRGAPASMAATDPRMKTLHEMHQKMVNAKTPTERQALMADHMKAMQGGMGMVKDMQAMHAAGGMGPMGSSNAASPMAGMGEGKGMPDEMAKRHQMMTEHMAMMQMMMDMMTDRMPPASMGK